MMQPEYTIPESAKVIGIRNGRLREWVDRDYIKPNKPAQHRGDNHRLSPKNIFQAKLFQCLINRGFMRRMAAKIAQQYKNKDFLCVTQEAGRFSYSWHNKNDSIKLKATTEDIFLINLGLIRDSVDFKVLPAKVVVKDNA